MKYKKRKNLRIGSFQKRILLILLAGVALSGTRSARKQWRIIKGTYEALKEKDLGNADRAVDGLFRARLVREKPNRDGTTTLVLTNSGRYYALKFDIENMKLPQPEKWDGKWRIVMYDIPRRLNKVRESLRYQLKRMGMEKIQGSVYIYPHECLKEIKYVMEFHKAWKFVRFATVESIDGEAELKRKFSIKI